LKIDQYNTVFDDEVYRPNDRTLVAYVFDHRVHFSWQVTPLTA